ncbi:hypothetical protein WR25_11950 [Diploscapter pachys]|uniref:Uncharacterized protein n=1 Tax=Diploscapter pachys TaxID=2018661 RepID=A0A2A2LK98_9BILA|nr:hypothetical protein WR25_11950 [Diploscapter pachys]
MPEDTVDDFNNLLKDVVLANFCGASGAESSTLSDNDPIEVGLLKTFWLTRGLTEMKRARSILESEAGNSLDALQKFRYNFLLQRLLSEPSIELKAKIAEFSQKVDFSRLDAENSAQFHLEQAQAALFYREFNKAAEFLRLATEKCGLKSELVGKLGKRTRFQQKELAQLVLDTVSTESSSDSALEVDEDLPPNCVLNDDTLLEKVELTSSDGVKREAESGQLSALQLACLLLEAQLEMKSQPRDELTFERVNAYLDLVISSRRSWAVQSAALTLRCELERRSNRKVERACQQAEALKNVNAYFGKESTPLPSDVLSRRASLALACGVLPFWELRILHSAILKSLGCTSEALLEFESLQMWDEAESLICRLLEERPNDSSLYVHLGDITQQQKYYEKAIEISNDRNARARRSLGHMLLQNHKYEEAYGHLRRSLELQPIQLGVWFNAGHCAWKLENYQDAITCYMRCVNLEPDHFEAWNNLSAAFIRSGQKERAFKLLQEALKFNYEHANIWENYMILAVDVGEIGQAITAFHRLLDLKGKQKDDEVLEILAKETLNREAKAQTPEEIKEVNRLKNELIKLYGRVSSTQNLSWKAWLQYALLKKPFDESPSQITEFEKYVQLLERAITAMNSEQETPIDQVVKLQFLLAEERVQLAKVKGSEDALKQAKFRSKMALNTLESNLEKRKKETGDNLKDESFEEHLKQVRQKIEELET